MITNSSKKRFYTAAWCIKDEESFRLSIPLELLGESLQRYKSSIKINIVMLEGYDKLSSSYLETLKTLGFKIFDYYNQFQIIIKQFPNIDTYYNHYERNCFLRWITFKNIIDKEPELEQFWHLDGDIILHASLDELSADTLGKTFMLEGCPVLVSISDLNWFKTYEIELQKLDANIKKYSQKAFEQKDFCRKNDRLLCNQSLYRNPLGSDQDFLEYLVSAKIIKQDSSPTIFNSLFHFTQNPLVFSYWDEFQNPKNITPIIQEGTNKEIWYGNKRVPFVHYQNTFCYFATIYMVLAKFGLTKFSIIRKLVNFKINETKFSLSMLSRLVLKFARIFKLMYPREKIIKFLNNQNETTKQMHLVELINFINEKSNYPTK